MYEFLDAHGERVTIRSARTLAGLLQRGAITAATPFRRAEDAAFGPAAKHPELRAIAAQYGVGWDGVAGPAERQAPDPAASLAAAPPARPGVTRPPGPRASVPATPRTVTVPVTPRVPAAARATPVLVARASPWSRYSRPARRNQGPAHRLVGSAGLVLLNLASAAVLGAVARFVVADASGARVWAMVSMVAVTALGGRYAGRVLAGRSPRPTGWAVSLAAAMFAAGCYGVAGAAGLVVAAAAAVPLWQGLSQPRR